MKIHVSLALLSFSTWLRRDKDYNAGDLLFLNLQTYVLWPAQCLFHPEILDQSPQWLPEQDISVTKSAKIYMNIENLILQENSKCFKTLPKKDRE